MIVLSAAVMKADERILKSELDYVKRFFVSNFGQQQAERYVLTLREVLKQDVDTRAVCRQIHGLMEHSKRLLLLQYLYGIAQADGHVDVHRGGGHPSDGGMAGHQREGPQVHRSDLLHGHRLPLCGAGDLRAGHGRRGQEGYRRMAVKFHPDKVGDMGADYQKQARARFDRIQAAYEAIKKQRGMK